MEFSEIPVVGIVEYGEDLLFHPVMKPFSGLSAMGICLNSPVHSMVPSPSNGRRKSLPEGRMGTRPPMQYAILPFLSLETMFIEVYTFLHAPKMSSTLFACIKTRLASIVSSVNDPVGMLPRVHLRDRRALGSNGLG